MAEAALSAVIERTPGLESVFVSSVDGITLFKASSATDKMTPEGQARIASLFTFANEQVSKLRGLGALQSITSWFDDSMLLHINDGPLVVTLVGAPGTNVGVLHALAKPLKEALEPLRALTAKAAGEQ